MRVNYRSGQWNALVVANVVVVLPPQADGALIADVWNGLSGTTDLGAVVDLLSLGSGGSLAGLPDFAALAIDGSNVRIAVRGIPDVVVSAAHGEEHITGKDVTTWSERLVRDAHRVEVTLQDAAELPLPLVGGIVRVGAVVVETGETSAATSGGGVVRAGNAANQPVVAAAPSAPEEAPVVAPVLAEVPEAEHVPAETPVAGPEEVLAEAPVAEPAIKAESGEHEASGSSADTLLPEDLETEDDVDEFDMLWGATVHKPAVNGSVVSPVGVPVAAGDHDGATISLAEAQALRKGAPVASPEAPTVALPVTPGATIGRIRLSTGQTAELDRTVIVGRRPRSTRASGANLPHLMAVESPQQDISRSHLEIRPEGDTVVVIDLHTTNGSTLLRPGADPVRLHPGEQTLVLSGDTVDLGDGVTIAFEDLP